MLVAVVLEQLHWRKLGKVAVRWTQLLVTTTLRKPVGRHIEEGGLAQDMLEQVYLHSQLEWDCL
jgi:hypothetical protein